MATPPDFTAGQVLTAAQLNKVGLWLVKTQTIGTAVSSVVVADAFSADYENYRVIVSGGAGSTPQAIAMVLGSTTAGYYWGAIGTVYSTNTAFTSAGNNAASFNFIGYSNANGNFMSVDILAPNLAKNTRVGGAAPLNATDGTGFLFSGYLANTTAYTAFTISVGGTMTGGTIFVYGYRG